MSVFLRNNTFILLIFKKNFPKIIPNLVLATKKVFLKKFRLANFIFYQKISNHYFESLQNEVINFLDFNISFFNHEAQFFSIAITFNINLAITIK